jgi:YebC/PmpR family DNA-binding regulatory protein
VPKENIARAIEKANSKGEQGVSLEGVLYEGFAPGGTALLIEGVTDNKQRTVSTVKNVLVNHGGRLGVAGSVSYLFQKIGEIKLNKKGSYDKLLGIILDIGGEDMSESEKEFKIITKPQQLYELTKALVERGFTVTSSSLSYKPQSVVPVSPSQNDQLTSLLQALEDLEDIHEVITNAVLR